MSYSAAESSVEVARPLVLAAVDHVPAALLVVLEEACRHLGVELTPWKSGQQPGTERRPAAVVAGLPEGARRIPEDLGRMLGRAVPRPPLLLLCNEPLARPTMTTQSNRVVLLGPPLGASRVASRLRMILAPTDATRTPEPRFFANGSSAVERLLPHCWVAALRAGEAASEPALYPDAARGLTALLSLRRGVPPEALVERVTATLKSDGSDHEKEGALFALLGVDRAVVHLDTASGDWLVYFPWRERALSLSSPRRVPHVWDFAQALERSRLLRVRAAGGDLLVSTTALKTTVANERELYSALDSGGPALLERLAGPRVETARPFAALLVELV